MSKTYKFEQIRPSNSNATWSLYSAKATNSSPCKKHGGGGVPSIIHLEIDRCVSPETAVWIVCCSALHRDLLWTLSVNLWVLRSGSEINMRRSHMALHWTHTSSSNRMAQIPSQVFSPSLVRCFMLMQQWIASELQRTCSYSFTC